MLHMTFMLVKLFYFSIENVEEAKSKIGYLLLDIKLWILRRKLKLNDRETEIFVVMLGCRAPTCRHWSSWCF